MRSTANFSALVACLTLFGCKAVVIPFSQYDASLKVDLTYPYIFTADDGTKISCNVNPAEISIKQTRKLSDGSTEIFLGGSIVVNGIPEGLQSIPYPDGIAYSDQGVPPIDLRDTDFPVNDSVNNYPTPTTYPRPLERALSLKSVVQNPKYTVVTISGIVPHGRYINVKEENEALRMLTNFYMEEFNELSTVFSIKSGKIVKNIVFFEDPNLFSKDGKLSDVNIFRGNNEQGGGFSVIIWDGANPKRATLDITDGNETKRVFIDWNNVNFLEIPLIDAAWSATMPRTVSRSSSSITYTGGTSTTKRYTATALVQQYRISDGDRPLMSTAEGLSPMFLPSNATIRDIYFRDENNVRSVDGVLKTDFIIAEFGDRVMISSIQDGGAVSHHHIWLVIELPPAAGSSTPQTVEIDIDVTVV